MKLEKSKYAYNSKTIIKPSPYALTPSFISKHFCHTLLNNDCMMCVGGNLCHFSHDIFHMIFLVV